MFILTDGKNYVMENLMKIGEYISTTSPVQAKEFTYKQTRSLLQNKKKSLSWIKLYHMVKIGFDTSLTLSLMDTIVSLVVKVLWEFISLICFRVYLEVNVHKNPTCFSRWSVRKKQVLLLG